MTITADRFRQTLAQFASGVTVVTTVHNGAPIGVTASAFSSLSVDPPLITVALKKTMFSAKVIADTGSFAVNILSAHQRDFGMRFAGMLPDVEDRFDGVPTVTAVTGCPILPDTLGWVDCTVWAIYDGGDHSIFVGEVVAAEAGEHDAPLLYHNRLWRQSASLAEPTLPLSAEIIDVGLRDGLQTQEKYVPVDMKVAIAERLIAAGVRRIQVTSFVNPRLVPQMADADAVCARLPQRDDVVYNALVLNVRGLERAHAAGIRHVDTGVPASETLSRMNANSSIEEGMARMAEIVARAHELGMTVRGGVQTAFGCVYEGAIDRGRVVALARRFLAMGVDELSLSDSAGLGNPQQIRRIVQEVLPLAGDTPLVLHLHDTRGMGLANLLSALKSGVRAFDTSFGGLGGCPFIRGAKGNIATEDTVHMLHAMGITTGIDLSGVAAVSRDLEAFFGAELPAKMHRLV